jgi:outer membrane protein OmpA-like peptidoglycan-associated protein
MLRFSKFLGLAGMLVGPLACGGSDSPSETLPEPPDFREREGGEPAAKPEVAASEAKQDVEPADTLFFAFDSDALTEPARRELAAAASWLKEHDSHFIVIEGHADEKGHADYNLDLAHRRAAAVRDYLVSLGVPTARIAIVAHGESQADKFPADALNRRTLFYATEHSDTKAEPAPSNK